MNMSKNLAGRNRYQFENEKRAHEEILKEWKSLRNDLLVNRFRYDDIKAAKRNVFLSKFDKLFHIDGWNQFYETSIANVYNNSIFIRGAKIGPNEGKPNRERFIPKSDYIKEDNRFSPKGIEWLYIALGFPNNEIGRKEAINCSREECRAKKGDSFSTCQFKLNSQNVPIVDLTIGDDWNREKQREEIRKLINFRVHSNMIPTVDELMNEMICQQNIVRFYAQIMSKELFVKLKTKDKEAGYAPFHCIASYFKSYGYKGIIYKSTVYKGGKNLVLFNKNLAKPIASSIETIIV